jgi:hypothetical protein
LYSCCGVQKKEEGEERVGVGSRGKYPGALPHHIGKKRKKKKADRKVPDRPLVVKGERLLKKKKKKPISFRLFLSEHAFLFIVDDQLSSITSVYRSI